MPDKKQRVRYGGRFISNKALKSLEKRIEKANKRRKTPLFIDYGKDLKSQFPSLKPTKVAFWEPPIRYEGKPLPRGVKDFLNKFIENSQSTGKPLPPLKVGEDLKNRFDNLNKDFLYFIEGKQTKKKFLSLHTTGFFDAEKIILIAIRAGKDFTLKTEEGAILKGRDGLNYLMDWERDIRDELNKSGKVPIFKHDIKDFFQVDPQTGRVINSVELDLRDSETMTSDT